MSSATAVGRPFKMVDYEALPDGPWEPDGITDARNAFGSTPRPILYLWVFERPDSLCAQLVTHGWAMLGPTHLLVGPEARVPDPLIRSSGELAAAIGRFSSRAGRHACPALTELDHASDYLGCPINYLWCADRIWQEAFRALAACCRRFVIDVTAEETPAGLSFELAQLFGQVPAQDILLLFHRYRGNVEVTLELLGEVWRASPRASATAPPALVTYTSTSPSYLAVASLGLWTGRPSIPLASRAAHHAGWDLA